MLRISITDERSKNDDRVELNGTRTNVLTSFRRPAIVQKARWDRPFTVQGLGFRLYTLEN